MDNEMKLPKYYELVEKVVKIGGVIGCVAGGFAIVGGITFQYGFVDGLRNIFSGVTIVVLSVAGAGIVLCFLESVKAQIETRNAIVQCACKNEKEIK